MSPAGIVFLSIFISLNFSPICKAQDTSRIRQVKVAAAVDSNINAANCREMSASILLNSVKEKDDWQIESGPAITGVHYPALTNYSKPFPSWEMDRYRPDSSYFKNCDWMVLPDKKTVINTISSIPVVFTKKFVTIAPSKFKLIVKMLYDNMALLFIDSTRIFLNHQNADINRFIRKLKPEFAGFVSIPATFNFSYNASFYGGDFYDLVLPAGNHIIRIELFNNAYEMGCIIKGILLSANDEKIFCSAPIEDEKAELASILIFNDKKTFPENKVADRLYDGLMEAVKNGYWVNNLVLNDRELISYDTLLIKKGEKIDVTPVYITRFYNGESDTAYMKGSIKKITSKSVKKLWDKTLIFNTVVPGKYLLEIYYDTPADATHTVPRRLHIYNRVLLVK